jgi:hypothetical protein
MATKTLRLVIGAASWTCWTLAFWIGSHSRFETLRAPGAKWYFPGSTVTFSVPAGTRILVRNIDSVSPWYIEKLGMHKSTGNNVGDSGGATFRFKEDGNPVVLATRHPRRSWARPDPNAAHQENRQNERCFGQAWGRRRNNRAGPTRYSIFQDSRSRRKRDRSCRGPLRGVSYFSLQAWVRGALLWDVLSRRSTFPASPATRGFRVAPSAWLFRRR